jgi:hypothetical protein
MGSRRGRRFYIPGVFIAFALCNHSLTYRYKYICCTTGFKIELPNNEASVRLVTVPIHQHARQGYSLQAEPCSAARTNVVFTNSYLDNNSSFISE